MLYKFDELSEQAREKAITDYQHWRYLHDYMPTRDQTIRILSGCADHEFTLDGTREKIKKMNILTLPLGSLPPNTRARLNFVYFPGLGCIRLSVAIEPVGLSVPLLSGYNNDVYRLILADSAIREAARKVQEIYDVHGAPDDDNPPSPQIVYDTEVAYTELVINRCQAIYDAYLESLPAY